MPSTLIDTHTINLFKYLCKFTLGYKTCLEGLTQKHIYIHTPLRNNNTAMWYHGNAIPMSIGQHYRKQKQNKTNK